MRGEDFRFDFFFFDFVIPALYSIRFDSSILYMLDWMYIQVIYDKTLARKKLYLNYFVDRKGQMIVDCYRHYMAYM